MERFIGQSRQAYGGAPDDSQSTAYDGQQVNRVERRELPGLRWDDVAINSISLSPASRALRDSS